MDIDKEIEKAHKEGDEEHRHYLLGLKEGLNDYLKTLYK